MINSKNLRVLRVKYDFTQKSIAAKLGISEIAYRQKENNIRPFTLPEAKTISDLYGISIEEIFFTDEVHDNGTKVS